MSEFLDMNGGNRISLDEHGFLLNRDDWSKAVASKFAGLDDIQLTDQHWVVIDILRDYYKDYEIEPPMRALVKALKDCGGELIANSLALYRLFPQGPVRQGSRYAGLPIPVSCI
jgi:TusE/DsrC/DsvC family sulfur relay protein